jgi:hypothetical protein
MAELPTIFHLTHWKSGSQWIRQILKSCAPYRFVPQEVDLSQYYRHPVRPGKVYAAMYINRQDFEDVLHPTRNLRRGREQRLDLSWKVYLKNFVNFQVFHWPVIRFFVMRDLRDTLVSRYFSYKISHPLLSEQHRTIRQALQERDQDGGLLYLMETIFDRIAAIQLSWINSGILMVRYEDLLVDEHGTFEKIINYCQIEVEREKLHRIITDNSFMQATGRRPGEEDVTSHLRKGISGDWKNYFTDGIKAEFKRRYPDVLIKTGYESGPDW